MARSPLILFADNDPDFLATRKEFLEREGYDVAVAHNTVEARRALDRNDVQLAILDIRLLDDDDEKDISGLALAKVSAHQGVPKIILTNYPSYAAVRESLKPDINGLSPVVAFLSKQEGPDAMLAAVGDALDASRRLRPSLLRLFLPLIMLLAIVLSGVFAVVSYDPRWLVVTAGLAIFYAVSTWWFASE